AQRPQQRPALVVIGGGGDNRDVHTTDTVDAVDVDLMKDRLFRHAEGIVAGAVELLRPQAPEGADPWRRDRDQAVRELPPPITAQGNLDADRHPLTQLELGDRLLRPPDDRL